MPKIPIEIITYILDFVDLRSATRFALAFALTPFASDYLNAYLVARIKNIFGESLSEIRNRTLTTYDMFYDADIYELCRMKSLGDMLIVPMGRLNTAHMYESGEHSLVNRKKDESSDFVSHIRIVYSIVWGYASIYIWRVYDRISFD